MIIINADDFGLNGHCSRAIAEAFEKGLITDTTMMATGEYFDEAVSLAAEKGFSDKIGIHLNLTEGVPLTGEIRHCPRFVLDGRFHKGHDRTQPLTRAEADAVYRELSAQARRMEDAGIRITHADSHHHVHTGEHIAPIALRVCREHGIDKMRLFRNLGAYYEAHKTEADSFNALLRREGIRTVSFFVYMADIGGIVLPDDTEILVHPDFDKDGRLIDRRRMTDGIPDGSIITAVDTKGYALGGYADRQG